MPLSIDVRPLLAARAATDPDAARLLEMFTKADEILSEHSLERIRYVEMPPTAGRTEAVAAETYLTVHPSVVRLSRSPLV